MYNKSMVHIISFKIQWLILMIYFLGKKKNSPRHAFCFIKKSTKNNIFIKLVSLRPSKMLRLGGFEFWASSMLRYTFNITDFFFLITTLLLLIKLGGIEDLKLLLQLIKKGKKKKNFLCCVFAWFAYEWLSKT